MYSQAGLKDMSSALVELLKRPTIRPTTLTEDETCDEYIEIFPAWPVSWHRQAMQELLKMTKQDQSLCNFPFHDLITEYYETSLEFLVKIVHLNAFFKKNILSKIEYNNFRVKNNVTKVDNLVMMEFGQIFITEFPKYCYGSSTKCKNTTKQKYLTVFTDFVNRQLTTLERKYYRVLKLLSTLTSDPNQDFGRSIKLENVRRGLETLQALSAFKLLVYVFNENMFKQCVQLDINLQLAKYHIKIAAYNVKPRTFKDRIEKCIAIDVTPWRNSFDNDNYDTEDVLYYEEWMQLG